MTLRQRQYFGTLRGSSSVAGTFSADNVNITLPLGIQDGDTGFLLPSIGFPPLEATDWDNRGLLLTKELLATDSGTVVNVHAPAGQGWTIMSNVICVVLETLGDLHYDEVDLDYSFGDGWNDGVELTDVMVGNDHTISINETLTDQIPTSETGTRNKPHIFWTMSASAQTFRNNAAGTASDPVSMLASSVTDAVLQEKQWTAAVASGIFPPVFPWTGGGLANAKTRSSDAVSYRDESATSDILEDDFRFNGASAIYVPASGAAFPAATTAIREFQSYGAGIPMRQDFNRTRLTANIGDIDYIVGGVGSFGGLINAYPTELNFEFIANSYLGDDDVVAWTVHWGDGETTSGVGLDFEPGLSHEYLVEPLFPLSGHYSLTMDFEDDYGFTVTRNLTNLSWEEPPIDEDAPITVDLRLVKVKESDPPYQVPA